MQLLLNSGYSTSFQVNLREKIHHVFKTMILPNLILDKEVPTDLFVLLFTSLSLSLAEHANQSKTPIDNEQFANLFYNILLHGPAKTLGLVEEVEPQKTHY